MTIENAKVNLSALLPTIILLIIDFFALYLQPQSYAISHFSLAIIIVQMLTLLLFLKADMCPGQCDRLIDANKGLIFFWLIWLCVSGFSNYHYLMTDLVSLCGIGITIAIWRLPKKNYVRPTFIYLSLGIGIIAILVYLMMFINISFIYLPIFNPFSQFIVGIILLNFMLIKARNRLDNFMALLPMTILIALLINAIIIFTLLTYCDLHSIYFPNNIAWILYFTVHILLLVIIGFNLLFGKKLDDFMLLLLFIMSASLPLWAVFAYHHY